MADIGKDIETLSALDTSKTLTAGNDNDSGNTKDIGANTSPQAVYAVAQFSITNAAANDGYDVDIRVQFSDDDSNWPDAGQGTELINFYSSDGGDDLGLSRLIRVPVLLRYFRFEYDNNNSIDNLDIDSEVALVTYQTT